LAVLEGLGEEYKYKPGVVAVIAALYEKIGDIEGTLLSLFPSSSSPLLLTLHLAGAGRTLDRYVEWVEKQKDLDVEQVGQVLRLNGEFKLQHKKYVTEIERNI
jgi:hypothetical protein